MPKENRKIQICMGSSCFSRGNSLNAEYLQRLEADQKFDLHLEMDLSGTLCEGLCKDGPIVIVDGVVHRNVSPTLLQDILATSFTLPAGV